jgi:hypothetical protein
MRSELAAEKMEQNPPPSNMIIVTGSDVLFLDELSGRYFHNQVENIKKAVNDINHQVNNNYCASLTEFLRADRSRGHEILQFCRLEHDELLEVQFTPTMFEDKPAILLGFNHEPISGYDRCQ